MSPLNFFVQVTLRRMVYLCIKEMANIWRCDHCYQQFDKGYDWQRGPVPWTGHPSIVQDYWREYYTYMYTLSSVLSPYATQARCHHWYVACAWCVFLAFFRVPCFRVMRDTWSRPSWTKCTLYPVPLLLHSWLVFTIIVGMPIALYNRIN